MPKQIWEIWPELTVTADTGSTYIQTPDEKWAEYLSIWRRAIREDPDTTCPCPMPYGHLMFKGIKPPPKKDQKQMEFDWMKSESKYMRGKKNVQQP